MPELPEVETIVRGLKPRLEGAAITSVDVLEERTIQFEKELLTEVVAEQQISSIWRRAKVMIWDLGSGFSLLFHLKMTGQIIYRGTKNFAGGHPTKSMLAGVNLPDTSTRVIFYVTEPQLKLNAKPLRLDDKQGDNEKRSESYKMYAERASELSTKRGAKSSNGVSGFAGKQVATAQEFAQVFFNDQRKFGWIKLLPTAEVHSDKFIKSIGPEHDDAASFTPKYLWSKTRNRITPIKAILLDQTVVAGIGNIYADEALHLAKIHPARKASTLSKSETAALFNAILRVIKMGIDYGGTSFSNFVNSDGNVGSYIKHARVFRREGQLCPECGNIIVKTRVAGRGTHYCPTCQPPPKGFKL